MATKKDLVEAYSFSRRRLVTAFVSGAPGGREVEPTRPGRTIVGGFALAVLLVAGAAIAGVFAPRTPDDWTKPGLIVSKETGAAYVIIAESSHPVLRPVINITSARLILGSDIAPTIISQKTIDAQTIGDDIGILGAPASLPTPSLLIDDGWTVCTGDKRGMQIVVATTPEVETVPDSGFVVQSNGVFYVLAQARESGGKSASAYRYELPAVTKNAPGDDQDNMLRDLGLPIRDDAPEVPEDWLALFPTGGVLDWPSFGVDGIGDEVGYAGSPGVPSDAEIGDVVTFPGLRDASTSLLFTARGPTILDPFSLAVYRHTITPTGKLNPDSRAGGGPVETTADEPPVVGQVSEPYLGAQWPAQLLDPVSGEQCAELDTAPGEAPAVQIATNPSDDASAADITALKRRPTVDAGRGAYVLSGDWTDTTDGSPFVVDAKGITYPLVGPDTAERLGYGDYPVVVVPDSWIKLFDQGVNLSVDDALCPPDPGERQTCG